MFKCDDYPTKKFLQIATQMSTCVPRRPLLSKRTSYMYMANQSTGFEEPQKNEVGLNINEYGGEVS